MTNWDGREIDIPLSFLGPDKYTAAIYQDSDDAAQYPKDLRTEKRTVDNTMQLQAKLAPGGGYAARFVPLNQ